MANLTLYQCPKFQHCNAPICPLDKDWQKRKHFKGDCICFYLLETQKHGAKANFEGLSKGYLYEAIVTLTPDIAKAYSPIKKALEKAKLSSSRMTRKFGREHEK